MLWEWGLTGARAQVGGCTAAAPCRVPCVHNKTCCRPALRYYDLAVLRNEFGWIDGYVASKPGRYHEGVPPGDLSQTGQVAELLLRSLAEHGVYDAPDFCARLDGLLGGLDGTPYCVVQGRTEYTDVAMRDVWRQRKVRTGGGGGWVHGTRRDACRTPRSCRLTAACPWR